MIDLSFTPFPALTTERLILRKPELSDDEVLFTLRSDDRVNKYIDRPKARTIGEVRAFIQKINEGIRKDECVYWVISLKGKTESIGTICFWNISRENARAEIGYELLPDYQGKGFMQEAILRVITFGFENMKLLTIHAFTRTDNGSSVRLLERNHFRRDEEFENTFPDKEELKNNVIYALTHETHSLKAK